MANIPQETPCEEMVLAAVGAINDDSGSLEDDIFTFIRSAYEDLPPDPEHHNIVKEFLKKLVDKQLIGTIPIYDIKHPSESFSDHAALHFPIIEAIKNLEHRGGSTELSIADYIHNKLSDLSAESFDIYSDLKDQLVKLVNDDVLSTNNVYFLLSKGRNWLNRIHVPFYNDPGLEKWKRYKTTSVEGRAVRDWEESETKKAKMKKRSIAKVMRDTKPRPFRMEDI